MRELVLARLRVLMKDFKNDIGRWSPIIDCIAVGHTSRELKKDLIRDLIRATDEQLFLCFESITDEKLIEVFEVAIRRRYTQR